jgi:zinc protease
VRKTVIAAALGVALLAAGPFLRPVGAQVAEEGEASGSETMLARLPVERRTLDNGLRVVLSPDPTIPTIAIAVYYDVGSRNEIRGRSGFAHLFEHMMFQGSANVAKGQHFALIMNRGGSMNGTTNADRTNYYETLPANELALGLWLEADRMRSLAVTEENFENQRIVVIQEYRQSYENRPYALSGLRINELAYGEYWPYAHSTIGDLADLQNAPLSAVQQFWMSYYPPNNAVLSVSGDFDVDEAMTLIEEYFGDIARRPVPPYEPPDIQPQTAERADTMVDPLAPLPAMHIAWHIPPNRADDHYALEMLGLILGDGDSSRFYQQLVKDERLATEIYAGTDDRRGPDLFSVYAEIASGHSPDELRPFIFEQIEAIGREGVTARELEKAQNRVRSYFVFGLQANLQRAQRLAEYELYYGDATLIRGELERYLAVTRDDIARVAARYLTETNRTVLDVLPPAAADEEEE